MTWVRSRLEYHTCNSSIRHHGYYLSHCSFCAATIWGRPLQCVWGQRLFFWKALRCQWRLDKVRTSETVTVLDTVSSTRSLSVLHAVSRGNNSYNTNSPSASVVTITRNHSHTCACAAFISCGYYSRARFFFFIQELWIVWLLFKGCHYSRDATIQGMPLFEGSVHLKKYSKLGKWHINFDLDSLPGSCSPLIPGSPMSW